MNKEQAKLLTKMRKLIKNGNRRFEDRPDRNYLDDLLEIGISLDETWNYLYSLNYHFYFPDPKPNYSKSGESLTFKREINGIMVYIKLKIEINNNNEETVCIAFHKDTKGRGY